jgi:membrane protease subunit (stomatin/prohibitin family)
MRRKRSDMTINDCIKAISTFAKKVEKFMETSDGSTFSHRVKRNNMVFMPDGQINVAFAVKGKYGVAEDLFEALRVLGEHKLPKKEEPKKVLSFMGEKYELT